MSTWSYNGSTNALSVTFACNSGDHYELGSQFASVSGAGASGTASGSSMTLTGTISDPSAGQQFDVYVVSTFPTSDSYIDSNIFTFGTSSTTGDSLDATWSYNGTTGFSVEFAAPNNAHNYQAIIDYVNGNTFTATGGSSQAGSADTTCSATASSALDSSTQARLRLIDATNFQPIAVRIFVAASSGSGSAGSPGSPFAGGGGGGGDTWVDDVSTGAGGVRVGIALGANALDETLEWTDITAVQPTLVASYQIDRGRQYELDLTDAGSATITLKDRTGATDPTNPFGPYDSIGPDLPIRIDLWNPVAEEWQQRFGGWIDDVSWDLSGSQKFFTVTITCYGIFALMTAIEMQPGVFGDVPVEDGTVFFDNADFKTRIEQVLTNANIPDSKSVVFSGNVELLEGTYSAGEDAMQPIQDCVDAELPSVANVYEDRYGRLAAHGRLAVLDPASAASTADPGAWNFRDWKLGDEYAFLSDGAFVQMRPPFTFSRGKDKIINQATAYPADIADADIADQVTSDATSIGLHGYKSWSKPGLLTKNGLLTGNDGNTETLLFAAFQVANYKDATNRVGSITVKSMRPDDDRGGRVWDMLCNSDIADRVAITTTHPGDDSGHGGFDLESYFIQGIHETATPLNGEYAMVTLNLDLSPAPTQAAGLDGAT